MKKKFAAAAIAMAMIASLAAPCGSESVFANETDSAGDVTLSLYIPTLANYADDAVAEVEDALNEIYKERYGFTIDINYIEIGNFEQAINLAMTTDELDVTCYFTGSGQLVNYVNNGQLLDITDYYENSTGTIKETFTDAEMAASSMNGRLYGFVRKYQYGGYETVVMNKEICEALGIDNKSIDTMDELEAVLYQVHEAYPDIYTMVPQSMAEMTWCKPWQSAVGSTSFAYAEDVNATELKSVFELDSFAEFCSYTNKWYNDGLIMSDALSNTMEGSDLVTSGAAFCCFHNGDTDPLENIYPNTVTTDYLVKPYALCSDVGNLQYGVSANSAHPAEAYQLLCSLYTDADIHTLLSYGIENEHWVYDENGRADYPEGMTAENEPYGGFSATAVYPDYLLNPVKATATTDNYAKQVEEWDNSVTCTPVMGLFIDCTEYKDFLTAYSNLEDKYINALMTGSVALEDLLPSIQSELQGIGFYEMLEMAQEQVDAYLAQ